MYFFASPLNIPSYPYVWGGSSPATSFDCSGFVSYVYNNCGQHWSFGRLGAEGLRGMCAYVSPESARPGDLTDLAEILEKQKQLWGLANKILMKLSTIQ